DPVLNATELAIQDNNNQAAFWTILGSLSFWALFSQMIFKAAGYNLLVTFFPTYLELAHQIAAEKAGELTSWSLVAVVIGSLLGGRIIDQLQRLTGNKRISRVGVASTTLLLTASIMAASCYAVNGEQVAAMIAVSSFTMGIAGPCAWAASIDVGGKNTAVVMGLLNMGGALSGIFISPLIGRLIDSIKLTEGNWNLVIQAHALFYLIAALCWLAVTFERTPDPVETIDAV
ncbi:MAG: sugar phosphate permease, partial [Planctomycetaceae bacterium]|nr:sugar phosphate permease [Planctomycetaceae bacterium]